MKFFIKINNKPLPKGIRPSTIEYKAKNNFLMLLNKNPLLKPLYYDNSEDSRNLEVSFFIDCNTHNEVYEKLLYLEGLFSTPCLMEHGEIGQKPLIDDVYLINMGIEYLSITGKAIITCNFLALGNYGELYFSFDGTNLNEYVNQLREKAEELKGHKHPIISIGVPNATNMVNILPYDIKFHRQGTMDIVGGDEIFTFSNDERMIEFGSMPYLRLPLGVNFTSGNLTYHIKKGELVFPRCFSNGRYDNVAFNFKIRKRVI